MELRQQAMVVEWWKRCGGGDSSAAMVVGYWQIHGAAEATVAKRECQRQGSGRQAT